MSLYTEEEDRAIVDYVLKYSKCQKLGGNKFWIKMASKLDIDRSPDSMKERFRSTIIKELIDKYKVSDKKAAVLRRKIAPKFRGPNNELDKRCKEQIAKYERESLEKYKKIMKEIEIDKNNKKENQSV